MDSQMTPVRRRMAGPVIPAIILIVLGVLFLLTQNHILESFNIWRLWPVLLVIAGASKMYATGSRGIEGWMLMIVGALLLASNLGYIHISLAGLWPVALILVGGVLLFKAVSARRYPHSGQSRLHDENFVMFGGADVNLTGQPFSGTSLSVIFGGYNLDLRNATLAGDEAVVDVSAVFGGVDIRVPPAWNVNFQCTPIFGGFGDETTHPDPRLNPPQLFIRGSAVFGGVNVKN